MTGIKARAIYVWLIVTYAFCGVIYAPMTAEGQDHRGQQIATLVVRQPPVTVNGLPAANGMPLSSGDTVSTGSQPLAATAGGQTTLARVQFALGGSLDLDQNTTLQISDPSDQGFRQGARKYFYCLIHVNLLSGQLYYRGGRQSICLSDGKSEFIPESEFNLQVAPGQIDVLTVKEGHVSVLGVQSASVPAGAQASIAQSRIIGLQPVTPDQTFRIAAWRNWLGPNDSCGANTLLGYWNGLRSALAPYGISYGLQNQTELWGNLTGGFKKGVVADGLLTASLCIDLSRAVQWTGATIYASGLQIYGPEPTFKLVGALQLVSNIEAAYSTKLYDLWLEQMLFDGKLAVRFGQEGSNDEMMLAGYAGLFLNSSFGYPALLAIDLPSGGPNYPLASPFFRVNFSPNDEISLLGAIYTDDPAPPGTGDPQLRDRHGTAFRFDDHALSFTELWYSPAFLTNLNLPGTYKLGAWFATGPFADIRHDRIGLSLANPASDGIPAIHAGDYALYGIINQMFWHKPNTEGQGIGYFLQVMHAPEDRNLSDWFIEGGLNWKGPLPNRSHDEAGLAVTYAGIGAAARRYSQDLVFYSGLGSPYAQGEPIIEATYRARLTPWFKLQPDLQYVFGPGAGIPTPGHTTPLKNALVVGLRMTVNF
jgi:porin